MESFWNLATLTLAALATAGVGALIAVTWSFLRSKVSAEQFALLQWIAAQAVDMAEQTYQKNEEKLAAAIQHAEKLLAQYNIKLDLDVIVAAIEAEVFRKKNLPPAVVQ